jgi:NAD(P)-dependent dehydrogenase (short-subunit alcohol dehydrogenase family)
MAGKLAGRVALITGGASGIGLSIAQRFLAEGARIMLADANAEKLSSVEKELGADVASRAGDVRVESDVDATVVATVERFGRLDIAVNSAGLGTYAPITEQTEEQWDTVVDVCLKGVFLSMKHEARAMKVAGDGGVIINIASLNAFQPGEGMSAYCAAKAGVDMLTRVASLELGPDSIRVCGIAPGLVDTPLTAPLTQIPQIREDYLANIPLGRSGRPEDIASAALYLASDEASWVSGTTLSVDGGSVNKRYPEFMQIFGALATDD